MAISTTGGGQVEERDQWLLALAKAEQVKYRERKRNTENKNNLTRNHPGWKSCGTKLRIT